MRLPLRLALVASLQLEAIGEAVSRRILHELAHSPEHKNGRRCRFAYRKGDSYPGVDVHTARSASRRAERQCLRIAKAMRLKRKPLPKLAA